MSSDYARNHCKIALAKILQTMGWNSINSTPLEVLTDVMVEYISQISKMTVDYAHEFGQTEPNLDHLGLAFQEMGVNLPEIEEYVTFVNFLPPPAAVPKFPLPKETNLNFLKPGSKEFVTRPVHINEHLPPMFPLLEEQDNETPADIKKEEPSEELASQDDNQTFKKPAEIAASGTPDFKRTRKESEGSRPTREISSVMMTTSGFLSPAREGRLPEAKAPLPPPEPPKPPTPEPVIVVPPPSEPPPLAAIVPPKKIKPEKKEKKLQKELFKPIDHEGKVKKIPEVMKEVLRLKQAKAAAAAAAMGGIPGVQPLHLQHPHLVPNIVRSELRMSFPGNLPRKTDVNKQVFNKTLAAAKAKTERLNTTITPIPTVKNEMPFHFPPHLQVDKLLNQPDKKKINILRKISNKPKQQQQPPQVMPHMNDPNDIVNKINLSSDITIEPIHPSQIKPKMEPYFESGPQRPPDMLKLNPVAKERKRKEKPEKPPKAPRPKKPRKTPHTFFSPDMVNLRMERPRPGPDSHFLGAGLSQFPPIPNLGNPLQFPFPIGGPGLIPTPLAPNLLFSSQMASFGKNPLFQTLVPPLEVPAPKVSPKTPKQRVKKEPKEPKQTIVKEIKEEPPVKEEPVEVVPLPNTPSPEKVEKIKSPKNEPIDLSTDAAPPATETKKSKEHKKEKKDKIKKKKDKKEKNKDKVDKALEKAEKKAEKKEKKMKEKEIKLKKKEKKLKKEIKEEPKEAEVPIPKILLKVNSPSPRPETPETMKKLNIKPIVKKEEEPSTSTVERKREPSPGLAKISALVTGPPKHKKEEEEKPAPSVHTPRPPGRPRIHPIKQKPTPKPKKQEVPFVRMDSEGNEIWICPSCGQQDDGRPMIGCDGCDAWYHWVCVGIQVPPDENENWYCKPCLARKNEDFQDKKKKRKKKDKKDH